MSLKHSYPRKYSLYEIGLESFTYNHEIWKGSRGFVPTAPLYYQDPIGIDYIVNPLYNKYNSLISYQLRDINDENTETKYKITRPVYDAFVKTDEEDIPGLKVICEGTMDCTLLRKHGINAWTSLGLKTFKVKRLLEELEDERFLYVLDNDSSGKFFSKKFFSRHGIEMDVPKFVKDVNELFKVNPEYFLKWAHKLKTFSNS